MNSRLHVKICSNRASARKVGTGFRKKPMRHKDLDHRSGYDIQDDGLDFRSTGLFEFFRIGRVDIQANAKPRYSFRSKSSRASLDDVDDLVNNQALINRFEG